jgi:Na(+)-translocating NADH:ubiquinone oxidoreductase F subunit
MMNQHNTHASRGITEEMPFKAMRKTWQPVALVRDLEKKEILEYTLLNEEIVVTRLKGKLCAFKDRCPHRGAKFAIGDIHDGHMRCPYHGWEFDHQGECQKIPSVEQSQEIRKLACLKNYPTQERYGMIWVKLDSDGEHELPVIPEFENDWTFMLPAQVPTGCGFRREIDNYLDMSHFAFAHSKSLGVAAKEIIEGIEISHFKGGFQMDAPFPRLENASTSKLAESHHRLQRTVLPNFTTIRQSFYDGDERVLIHIPSPNTETSCTMFWALAVSPGFKGPSPEDQIAFAIGVYEEDKTMMENQRPLENPIGFEPGVIVPSDRLPMTFKSSFRRWVMRTLREEDTHAHSAQDSNENKLLILYGSQSGSAESLANNLVEDMTAASWNCEKISMAEFMKINSDKPRPYDDLFEDNKMNYKCIIISSTYGQGNPPDNAKDFYEYLKNGDGKNLSHLDYCVFALGSKNYPNFCQCGKDFHALLANAGAYPFLDIVCCNGDPDVQYEQWQRSLCQRLNAPFDPMEREVAIKNNLLHKKTIGKIEHFLSAKVLSNQFVTPFIKELCLEVEENYDYSSGQFAYIKIPSYEMQYSKLALPERYTSSWEKLNLSEAKVINREATKRSYSFASSPSEGRKILKFNIRIALPSSKEMNGGIGSSYLFSLKAEDHLEITPAQGDFLITKNNKEKVYIGGGAGMAPLRSHIVDQLNNNAENKISFWYGARSTLDLFYIDEFKNLAQKHKNFTYNIALSEETQSENSLGYRGYIHEVVDQNFLKMHNKLYNIDFFLCGPPPMVQACLKMLKEMHVGDHQIFFDAY